jgi:sialic acid synthase SpsE
MSAADLDLFNNLQAGPIFIAEIGLNHNGDLNLALRLLEAAKQSGADFAKFQLYLPEHFIAASAALGQGGPGSLRAFFADFCLKESEWERLVQAANDLAIGFACSVFDLPSLDFYKRLLSNAGRPSFIKIASCDVTHGQLLKAASQSGLPLLLATGTASAAEVESAIELTGVERTLLMQCVSAYPASPSSYNLNVLGEWQRKYGCLTGISDHTTGPATSLAAIALGARAVERHFTLDKNLPGPDQALSLIPSEFKSLVAQGREVAVALGQPEKMRQPEEEGPFLYGRRAAYALNNLPAGSVVQASQVAFLRPGVPGSPASDALVVGRRTIRSIQAGSPILAEELA